MLIKAAIEDFKSMHDGADPLELVFTPHAALALGIMEEHVGILPRRVESFDGNQAVPPGQGKKLGFFVNTNGVQTYVAVTELK